MATKNKQGYYTGSDLTGQESRSNFAQGVRDFPSNFPLGAQRKNIKMGNPYLDQVKSIDKELKRLNDLAEKALKGSDNKSRDLKILNDQLRRSGELNRNALGIDRRFWSRRTLQDQMRALQARRDKLTNFLGKQDIKIGDQELVPKIKEFTPTFIKDLDSQGGVSKINPYYNKYFDKAARKRDQNIYDTTRSDMLGGTDTTGMSEKEIDELVQSQLPEGNMYRKDSQFYIGNVNEYGQKKAVQKSDDTKTGEVIAVNNAAKRNNYYKGREDDYAGLLIEQVDGTKKAPTSIQRNLLKAGFKPQELTKLMINDRDWRANRRR